MAILLLLASACSSPAEPSNPSGTDTDPEGDILPIELAAGQMEQTRATLDPLESVWTDFAIFGFKKMPDGCIQHVFSRDATEASPYKVAFTSGEWHYHDITYSGGSQYLKYWDLSAAYYQFSACAPWSASSKFSTDGVLTLYGLTTSDNPLECSYKRTRTPLVDYDLLISTTDPVTPDPAEMWSTVPLRFHHVLSTICFKIYNSEGTPLEINNFKVEISGDKKIHTVASTYTQPSTFEYNTSSDTKDICNISLYSPALYCGESRETATELFSTRVIPQPLTDINALITLSYEGGEPQKALIPLGDNWNKDKIYVYVLIIGPAQILVEIETEDWKLGGTGDEQEEHNW